MSLSLPLLMLLYWVIPRNITPRSNRRSFPADGGGERRGEEHPLLLVALLSWVVLHCTGKAPSESIHKQFLLLLELLQTCLSRQEKPSQFLLRWGIFALTHKHGAQDYNIKHHPNAVALSFPVTLLQAQLCHTGGASGHAGQQNIKSSKLFSEYFVYCASGFWLEGVTILSSLPWAVKATKMFVLDWCPGKSAVLGLFLYQVCQIPCYMWHTFFFPLSSLPNNT